MRRRQLLWLGTPPSSTSNPFFGSHFMDSNPIHHGHWTALINASFPSISSIAISRTAPEYTSTSSIQVSMHRKPISLADLGSHWEHIIGCADDAYVDPYGHGTAVAALAAGTTYGVAKGATLHSVRVMHCYDDSGESDDIIAGMDWVAQNRILPAVANYSGSGNGVLWYWPFTSVKDALQGMYQAGVVVVKSAGNTNSDACNDAGNTGYDIIVVGASTSSDSRASFSNWGSCVDIFAPGNNVPTITIGTYQGLGVLSGTSIAAPFVAGTAALILDDNPSLSPTAVWADILYSATTNVLSSLNGSPNRLVYTLFTRVWFDGPVLVTQPGLYTWTSHVKGGFGSGSWSYAWYESVDGGPLQLVGTSANFSRLVDDGYCQNSRLELHATYNNETVEYVKFVTFQVPECPI